MPDKLAIVIVLLLCFVSGCRKSAPAPATVTFLDQEWSQPDELSRAAGESREFTRETGIVIQPPPLPETLFSALPPQAQLDLLRRLLKEGALSPDVLGIDVIWPRILADHLVDLRPDFASELSSLDAQLVASYTVNGKVVALPYDTHVGVLAYRTDLLRQYGYSHPPKTWDELERMAARIQAGERAKGRKDFWGYIWQGAATESLTCNALEWQVSAGGGRIIEDDGTISVNNPAAIQSWQRAARWIGRISPPGVVAYQEVDSLGVWDSGNAAFMRSWQWGYRLTHPRESPMRDRTGYTSMPGGRGGQVGALGGIGLAVSQSSAHPREAVALIHFLIARDLQAKANAVHSEPAAEFYGLPQTLQAYAPSPQSGEQSSRLVSRPSSVTGHAYEDVTAAYIQAVHSVLTGQRGAQEAAAELEKQLIQITGFHAGPPKT
ncbi:trehalose/maltose transport system substrate-binding protein [Silvibacterium bohemicum]|uniref:Trehalose/maltose transport system substrate-binding protein n=1 Tax=Silvibacterium bohemicum TaxID=1577686 RepID=A0A841K1H3_9BACT|nr:extracellular solute-binding protein [Silvibacterium bohemicum]MBB6147406.1 trehalose/maltose transport system substrate-binding protein [Silvibacterium bohemicum]